MGKSWWIGRIAWLVGAFIAARFGVWPLIQQPEVWAVIGGAAAMGIGNYVRHNKLFDPKS